MYLTVKATINHVMLRYLWDLSCCSSISALGPYCLYLSRPAGCHRTGEDPPKQKEKQLRSSMLLDLPVVLLGCFHKLEVLLMGVLLIRALLYIKAPDFGNSY